MDGLIYFLAFLLILASAATVASQERKAKRKRERPALPLHERDKHERQNTHRPYIPEIDRFPRP